MQKIPLSRTRFADDIVAEFLPPEYDTKKVAILSPGAPGYPGGKNAIMQMLARRGYWSIVPRYRGTWESDGTFLEHAPSEDIRLIMDQVPHGFEDRWSGTTHCVREPEFYLIGGSFGGPSAILNSADERVKKVIAISSVVDWLAQERTAEPLSLMNEFIPSAFGMGYRGEKEIYRKLLVGDFYNPVHERSSIDGKKLLLIHAKDDLIVHAAPAAAFAKEVGAQFVLLPSGGHMGVGSAEEPRIWKHIERFLKAR